MSGPETQTQRIRQKFEEWSQSGIIRVYLIATAISIVLIALNTGDLGHGVLWGGYLGLFTAIVINETTPGYTLKDSWIAGDRS